MDGVGSWHAAHHVERVRKCLLQGDNVMGCYSGLCVTGFSMGDLHSMVV